MTKRKKKLIKSMKDAKKALMLSVEIGENIYEFESDLFDLEDINVGILNVQISRIPGYVAYVGMAYGEAEKELAAIEMKFDIWRSKRLVQYFSDPKLFKSEKDKENNLIKKFAKEYEEYQDEINSLKKLVRVLKSYEKGMEAKLQLAQTMSANIRAERDAITRNYDKDNSSKPTGKL